MIRDPKLAAAFKKLTYRERETIKLRFGIDGDGYRYTLEETARIFRCTRERIRQIEINAMTRLATLGIDREHLETATKSP
jgi:RNA polymerase primary sigma factor